MSFVVSGKAPWQLLGGHFHNLGSFPAISSSAFWKKGRHVSDLHPQHGTTLKDGAKVISSSSLQSKATAAAHFARVRGKEQGTMYLERAGETQRAYSERAECKTLLILYQPVTKQEDIRCILGTTQNIRCSQERTKRRNQKPSISQGLTNPATSLIGFDD
jgi:hypothetical protein